MNKIIEMNLGRSRICVYCSTFGRLDLCTLHSPTVIFRLFWDAGVCGEFYTQSTEAWWWLICLCVHKLKPYDGLPRPTVVSWCIVTHLVATPHPVPLMQSLLIGLVLVKGLYSVLQVGCQGELYRQQTAGDVTVYTGSLCSDWPILIKLLRATAYLLLPFDNCLAIYWGLLGRRGHVQSKELKLL